MPRTQSTQSARSAASSVSPTMSWMLSDNMRSSTNCTSTMPDNSENTERMKLPNADWLVSPTRPNSIELLTTTCAILQNETSTFSNPSLVADLRKNKYSTNAATSEDDHGVAYPHDCIRTDIFRNAYVMQRECMHKLWQTCSTKGASAIVVTRVHTLATIRRRHNNSVRDTHESRPASLRSHRAAASSRSSAMHRQRRRCSCVAHQLDIGDTEREKNGQCHWCCRFAGSPARLYVP
jgi:hypothetical protein